MGYKKRGRDIIYCLVHIGVGVCVSEPPAESTAVPSTPQSAKLSQVSSQQQQELQKRCPVQRAWLELGKPWRFLEW